MSTSGGESRGDPPPQSPVHPLLMPAETEPLPPELRPILGEPPPVGTAADPVVMAFLRRQRRLEEQNQRREASLAQRLHRFLRKKFYLFRRR